MGYLQLDSRASACGVRVCRQPRTASANRRVGPTVSGHTVTTRLAWLWSPDSGSCGVLCIPRNHRARVGAVCRGVLVWWGCWPSSKQCTVLVDALKPSTSSAPFSSGKITLTEVGHFLFCGVLCTNVLSCECYCALSERGCLACYFRSSRSLRYLAVHPPL